MVERLPFPVFTAAVFTLVFAVFLNLQVFERAPHVNDELAYLFQAKVFLTGSLTVPSPCSPRSFDFPHIINNSRWYSQYPPGWPLLLTLGLLAGVPWLVNPLLAALSIFLFYALSLALYDRRTGVLAAVLGSLSIWLLLMSSTMMSHTAGLFFAALFVLFLVRSLQSPSAINGIAAGAALGFLLLVRPYTAFLIAFPFAVHYGLTGIHNIRRLWKNAAAMAAAFAVFAALLLFYNQATNGHPLRMGYIEKYGEAHNLGIGRTGPLDFPLTWSLAGEKLVDNVTAVNSDLFGWPLSSFLALIPLLFSGRPERRFRRHDILCFAGFAALLVGHYFYWGTDILYGARFVFEALFLLVLLSARGISLLPGLLHRIFRKTTLRSLKILAAGLVVVFAVYGFAVRLPAWIDPPGTEWYLDGFGPDFARVTPRIPAAVESLPLGRALVIMKILDRPLHNYPDGTWGSGFMSNDPLLENPVIYARDRGPENGALFDCFPDRQIYLYHGTVKKGLLVPLRREDGTVLAGEPLTASPPPRKAVELVADPADIFFVYSPEFRAFLTEVYAEHGVFQIDVEFLYEKGAALQSVDDHTRAAFAFEAALQIEKNPEYRPLLLRKLSESYRKTGNIRDARRITDKIAGADPARVRIHNVIPEKGI